ncbi:transglycosylase SLT domain-containing protein [Vibrio sp. WXL210]|uniref:transglycosylase SLT domain-containing protein n=1 Tax=Vibrio sp. WXL210 TaxID=3450709 RepID=UPI003EC65C35
MVILITAYLAKRLASKATQGRIDGRRFSLRLRKISVLSISLMAQPIDAAQTPEENRLVESCRVIQESARCDRHRGVEAADPADEFNHYKACRSREYEEVAKKALCELDDLVKVVNSEFYHFKTQVEQVWANPEFSSATQWVGYSSDLDQVTMVDFANNQLRIQLRDRQLVSKDEWESAFLQLSKLRLSDAQNGEPLTHGMLRHSFDELPLSDTNLLPVANSKSQQQQELQSSLKQLKVRRYEDASGTTIVEASLPFPGPWLSRKEQRYANTVKRYAAQYNLSPQLVMAVIKVESAFDPVAVSHIPAFGLMQIVPTSAGLDATEHLYGRKRQVEPAYLFDPQKNIQMGVVYLHLLKTRYFGGINDPQSLKHCMIAAYNGGMAPIYRLFGGGDRQRAIAHINRLSAEEVYQTIVERHRAAETRQYLVKVTQAESEYHARKG